MSYKTIIYVILGLSLAGLIIYLYKKFMKFTFPVQGKSIKDMSSDYGNRVGGFHNGIDIAAPINTPVVAPKNAKVISIYTDSLGGNQVILQHDSNLKTGYAHLNSVGVKIGDDIKEGQEFAKVGTTGYSTGPHLHFVVTYKDVVQDPKNYL